MFLTNHTLSGAVLALNIHNPVLLVPAAFMSHLALDSLPHFGHPGMNFKQLPGTAIAFIDCSLALTSYLLIIHHWPQHWFMITVGIFFACLPDLLYIPEIFLNIRIWKSLYNLHHNVQWGEFPGGIAIEGIWAAAMLHLLKGIH